VIIVEEHVLSFRKVISSVIQRTAIANAIRHNN